MSEHARRNLVCASWHKAPEGWHSWTGNVSGWTTRPFCWGQAGHAGDHWAMVETIDETAPREILVNYDIVEPGRGTVTEIHEMPLQERMTWPNTLGIPEWLFETTKHGIQMMREHGMSAEDILRG